jgi:hypothetical protein
LIAPVAMLAAVALAGGFVVGPFAGLAGDAAAVTHGAAVDVSPAYHLDARAENIMATAAWGLGAALLLLARSRARVTGAVARAGDLLGPRRWYGLTLQALNAFSDRLHDAEVRDLRNSIAAVLVPTGVLVALGFAFTPTRGAFRGTASRPAGRRPASESSSANPRSTPMTAPPPLRRAHGGGGLAHVAAGCSRPTSFAAIPATASDWWLLAANGAQRHASFLH